MAARGNDPDGLRLPIRVDSTSNGEFLPVPPDPVNRLGNRQALADATAHARRAGRSRRQFLVGASGAATTLLAFNTANAAAGRTGGFFDLPVAAAEDQELAAAHLTGNEFIFDIQGHYVDPNGRWVKDNPGRARGFKGFPGASCDRLDPAKALGHLDCLGPEQFVQDVFVDSDTDLMVLSFVPSSREAEPLTIEEAAATRDIVEQLDGSQRLMLHGRVNPNQDGDLAAMDELAERWRISAWKTYTQYGPKGVGYALDDETAGLPFVEKARALGVKNICIHKGLPFGPQSYEHSQCHDIGRIAKRYPDVNFIVYHAGFVTTVAEQAFAPGAGRDGIDTLVQSVLDNGIAPNSNVYAELGSTWRFLLRHPEQAAHALGKLLRHIGEDNVLWGTDSIWYGSPQDQIQAFRSFQISERLQEAHGYPAITPTLRAKVFGLNACLPYGISAEEVQRHTLGDRVAHVRQANAAAPDPHFRTWGPTNRRQFINLLRHGAG